MVHAAKRTPFAGASRVGKPSEEILSGGIHQREVMLNQPDTLDNGVTTWCMTGEKYVLCPWTSVRQCFPYNPCREGVEVWEG